jgi:hypothetical protein|tara:strand:+ start:156 stop:275 length:120 start_codon:yes stop_codon:yes gene_type:complete
MVNLNGLRVESAETTIALDDLNCWAFFIAPVFTRPSTSL